MKDYRVFVNDRRGGMYSAYRQFPADSPKAAIAKLGPVSLLPKLHAVEWPARSATDRQWLETYVGAKP